MTKSELRKIIIETIQKTAHKGMFRSVLEQVIKEDSEEEKAKRGHAILDKANPKNVERILKGKKPVYKDNKPVSEEASTVSISQVKSHIKDLAKDSPKTSIKINYVGGNGNKATATNSAENWIKKFDDLSGGSFTKEGEHSFKTAGKLFKSDTAVSPKDSTVKSLGSLD